MTLCKVLAGTCRGLGRWAMPLAALGLLAGCGKGPAELPEGCAFGEDVPASVRSAVEDAASRFYEHARKGEAQAIYEEAAPVVREKNSPEQFLAPIAHTARQLGFPPLTTRSLATIRFGGQTPYQHRLECNEPGKEALTTFLLLDHPEQASLVQVGDVGGETFNYSTVWFREEGGGWRIAAFFVRPATIFGKGSAAYAEEAAAQREQGNLRNAALLYNIAIDLAVPAVWIKPAEVEILQRQQRRITVSDLPADRLVVWAAPPDSFRVYSIAYTILSDGLGLLVRYEAPGAMSDTLAQAAYGDRLVRYMEKKFPEYRSVFRYLGLEGREGRDRDKVWMRTYPLEPGP